MILLLYTALRIQSGPKYLILIIFSNLNVKTFFQGNDILPCNCAGSGFIEKDHQNTVNWGDLQVAGINKLQKLLTKWPKYRKTNNILLEIAKSTTSSKVHKNVPQQVSQLTFHLFVNNSMHLFP